MIELHQAANVSVVIPAYNAALYLRETVDSVLSQSHPVAEIIIVDDGSTDSTFGIAKEIASQCKIVRAVSQQNAGVSAARNHGFRLSTGNIIAFLDSDDLWHRDFITTAVVNLNQDHDVFVASGKRFKHDVGDRSESIGPDTRFVKNFPNSLIQGNVFAPSMVAMKRRVCELVGNFADDQSFMEDWDYWIRAVNAGFHFHFNIDDFLVQYRITPGSRSANFAAAYERCINTLTKHQKNSITTEQFVIKECAHWIRRRGNVELNSSRARYFYQRAIQSSPLEAKNWIKWLVSWIGLHVKIPNLE